MQATIRGGALPESTKLMLTGSTQSSKLGGGPPAVQMRERLDICVGVRMESVGGRLRGVLNSEPLEQPKSLSPTDWMRSARDLNTIMGGDLAAWDAVKSALMLQAQYVQIKGRGRHFLQNASQPLFPPASSANYREMSRCLHRTVDSSTVVLPQRSLQ